MRTYLILITENHIVGVVGNGLVSVQGGDPLTSLITSKIAVDGDLMNPLSYLKDKYLKHIENFDLLKDDLSKKHHANFAIKISDITSVEYDPTKKWSMGYYPHDGKVYIVSNNKKREFIILGQQSGNNIAKVISNKIANK